MVEKAFCEFMDGSFGGSTTCSKANPHSEKVLIPVRTNLSPFHAGSDLM